jgi:hypothetical protein
MFGDKNKNLENVLKQLTNRLTLSCHQLTEAAKRLQLTELTYREYLSRLRKLDTQMNELVDLLRGPKKNSTAARETNPTFCQPPPAKPRRKLRYSDYIEFSNYAELRKFEKMGKITDREVQRFDSETLMRKLLEEPPRK